MEIRPAEPSCKLRHPIRYLFWVCSLTTLLVICKLGLSYALLGNPTERAQLACLSVKERQTTASRISAPKLVLIGGSSVRRGMNAGRIAASLHVPVVNFGLQAGLGPGIILDQAKRILRSGDVALLAFEFNHYSYERPTGIAVELVWGCFGDYYAGLPADEQLLYLSSVDGGLLLRTIANIGRPGLFPSEKRRKRSLKEQELICDAGIASSGDLPLTKAAFPPLDEVEQRRQRLYRPIRITFAATSRGVATIRAFFTWAKAHDVTVFATWPNTIAFPSYASDPAFEQIAEFYESNGVTVLGPPEIALLPLKYFYDTQYHLAPAGIRHRTNALIPYLKTPLSRQVKAARTALGDKCDEDGVGRSVSSPSRNQSGESSGQG